MAEKEYKTSKEEEIGFHKGALQTLSKERQEMIRIVDIVGQLIQMHVKALQELGVDLEQMAQKAAKTASKTTKGKQKPIDELL